MWNNTEHNTSLGIQSSSTGKSSDHPPQLFSHHASTLHSGSLDILSEVLLFTLNIK